MVFQILYDSRQLPRQGKGRTLRKGLWVRRGAEAIVRPHQGLAKMQLSVVQRTFDVVRLVFKAYGAWASDRCDEMSAALAFRAVLAIVPFLTIVMVLSAYLLGESWTRSELGPQILGWAGPHGAEVLKSLSMDLEDIPPETLVVVGVVEAVGLVIGASGFFTQLAGALGAIWGKRPQVGVSLAQVRKWLLGMVYAVVSAAITLAGFVGAALAPAIPGAIELVAFVAFCALASFWLKVLLPVRLSWWQVLPWGALIAGTQMAGRLLFNVYAALQHVESVVDAAAAMVLALLWFFYANVMFLYIAELMRLRLQHSGKLGVAEPRDGKALEPGLA